MAYSPDRYTNDPDYKEGMDCFLKGDFDGAMEHFKDAADNGNPEAEFRIAKLYYFGRGTDENKREALVWMRKAAQHGNPQAMNETAMM